MILTKKAKTIGASAVAVMILASVSTAAFASSNEKSDVVKKAAIRPQVEKIQVYDMQKNTLVDFDPNETPGSADSVPSTAAVPPIK
ncbi:hypothetical protein [Paenibacillus sp. 22594]|uniref:hypothetical protein n=1 Tax=Paenibacillus sp. 22594 TaxID=3453947 RepID=UPI003F86FBF0